MDKKRIAKEWLYFPRCCIKFDAWIHQTLHQKGMAVKSMPSPGSIHGWPLGSILKRLETVFLWEHTIESIRIFMQQRGFLGCFACGFFVFPLTLFIIFARHTEVKFSEFYELLSGGNDFWLTWSFILAPYLLFQFIRSIIWAWRTVRGS